MSIRNSPADQNKRANVRTYGNMNDKKTKSPEISIPVL